MTSPFVQIRAIRGCIFVRSKQREQCCYVLLCVVVKRRKRQQEQHRTTKHRQSTPAVIAEASRSTRYGTGSVAETAIRDLVPTKKTHVMFLPILTPLRFFNALKGRGQISLRLLVGAPPDPRNQNGFSHSNLRST